MIGYAGKTCRTTKQIDVKLQVLTKYLLKYKRPGHLTISFFDFAMLCIKKTIEEWAKDFILPSPRKVTSESLTTTTA